MHLNLLNLSAARLALILRSTQGGPTGSLASVKVTEPEGEAPAWCERPGWGRDVC